MRHEKDLRYAWYVAIVLTLCYTLSFVDRQILSLLVGPIKHDLHLSDTRVGLLQGLAFALFYTLLGLPAGRIVDLHNRRNLVMAGIALWSLFTGACAAARSFASLFLCRIGVGVGEATLNPASFSLISDYFPRERLGAAMSVFYLGAMLGSGTALAVGGMVVEAVGKAGIVQMPLLGAIASWRLTFLIVGLPGLLFALLAATIREPVRRGLLKTADGAAAKPPLREAAGHIAARWRPTAGISFGMAFQAMCLYGFGAWAPAVFQRVHGYTPGQAGRALGLVVIAFGCAGMLTGGFLSDRGQRRGIPDAALRLGLISALGAGILFSIAFTRTSASWTLALLGPALFFNALAMGPSVAALQLIYPNQLRGTVSALFLFILNIVGLSLGPLLPGLFSDYLFRSELRIGDALALSIALASVLMFILLALTLRPYHACSGNTHQSAATWTRNPTT